MEIFDIYVVKDRIKKARKFKHVRKVELEKEGIITRRHLQRLEDLDDPAFTSLAKLLSIASYLDVSMDYLLGVSEFKGIIKNNSYNDFQEILIEIFDTKLVEFDVIQSVYTSFFYFKDNLDKVNKFINGYNIIVPTRDIVDENSYKEYLVRFLNQFI